MSNMGEISFVIKNDSLKFETGLFQESTSIDLTRGQVVFKVPETSMKDIKRIYDSGQNLFYITSKLNSQTTSIYAGLFGIFDNKDNVDNINQQQAEIERDVLSAEKAETLIDTYSQNTAIVYRRRIGTAQTAGATSSTSNSLTNSSLPATTKINNLTYTITTNSSLTINGFEWTSPQIKTVLNLDSNPITLTIRTDSLFSAEKYLDTLVSLNKRLQDKYLVTPEDKTKYDQTVANFLNITS
jgi:hypothetical protein